MWSTGGLQGAKVNTRVAPNSHVRPVARDEPRLAATRLQKGSPKRPTTTALPLFFLPSLYYPRICQGIEAQPLFLHPFVQELHNKIHCTDFLQPQPSSFRIRSFLSLSHLLSVPARLEWHTHQDGRGCMALRFEVHHYW